MADSSETPVIFSEISIQQQDSTDSISCTGSGYCAEVAPGLLEFDQARQMCVVRGGACVKISGVKYSTGSLPPERAEQAIEALAGCDSEAVRLTDAEGNYYRSRNGIMVKT